MATILLTQQETLLSFELDESQIEMVRADAGGSYVERSDPHNTGYNGNPLFVTQTPAQIAAQSENLIPLVISKTGDQWTSVFLNGSVNHFGSIQADTTSVLGNSRFEYFRNGNTMEIYLAQETTATIAALLQQVEHGQNDPVFTNIAGATTLTPAQLGTGFVKCANGVYTIILPDALDMFNYLNAADGSTFSFTLLKDAVGAVTITKGANMFDGANAVTSVGASRVAVFTMAFTDTSLGVFCVISQVV